MMHPDGFAVLVPYKDLQTLLGAAERVSNLEQKVARLGEQYEALYGRYSEILEKLSTLQNEL